jgi:hypothetical protein
MSWSNVLKVGQIEPFSTSISTTFFPVLRQRARVDIFMKSRMKKILIGLAALVVATILWLPCLHLLFTRPLSEFR